MLGYLTMLAQDSAFFNLRNIILIAVIIGILVGYKIWKNKTMS